MRKRNNSALWNVNLTERNYMTQNTKHTESKASEYHVASLVAYPIFAQLDEVKAAITEVPGTEIHAVSEEGKIVFTIEGTSYKDIGKKMDIIRVHEGLLNLSPVYHQILDEDNDTEATYEQIQ